MTPPPITREDVEATREEALSAVKDAGQVEVSTGVGEALRASLEAIAKGLLYVGDAIREEPETQIALAEGEPPLAPEKPTENASPAEVAAHFLSGLKHSILNSDGTVGAPTIAVGGDGMHMRFSYNAEYFEVTIKHKPKPGAGG